MPGFSTAIFFCSAPSLSNLPNYHCHTSGQSLPNTYRFVQNPVHLMQLLHQNPLLVLRIPFLNTLLLPLPAYSIIAVSFPTCVLLLGLLLVLPLSRVLLHGGICRRRLPAAAAAVAVLPP